MYTIIYTKRLSFQHLIASAFKMEEYLFISYFHHTLTNFSLFNFREKKLENNNNPILLDFSSD